MSRHPPWAICYCTASRLSNWHKCISFPPAGVQIVFYFLYGNNMIAFAFLLSCLFISSRTAVVAGFLWVFGSGLIGDLLLRTFIQNNAWYMVLVELIPAFSLYR